MVTFLENGISFMRTLRKKGEVSADNAYLEQLGEGGDEGDPSLRYSERDVAGAIVAVVVFAWIAGGNHPSPEALKQVSAYGVPSASTTERRIMDILPEPPSFIDTGLPDQPLIIAWQRREALESPSIVVFDRQGNYGAPPSIELLP